MKFDFQSRRSMVTGTRGMVAASNPLAAQAGLRILQRGGTAADAAIAAAAVMNVVAPASTGIGGDCFALYFDASTRQVSALNGSGRAPKELSLDQVRSAGHTEMPFRNAYSVTVPGAVRGWADLLDRFGRFTLSENLDDAIYYATEGYPVTPVFGHSWAASEALLQSWPHTKDYLPSGRAPRVGQITRLPRLGASFQKIAAEGPEAFYEGEIAERIVATLRENGSPITLSDLREHHSDWGSSISINYRGTCIHEHPPNGQGLAALEALNIAKGWDIASIPPLSTERTHLMVEAMRLGFADAAQYVADSATNPAPIDFLLSEEYANERRALISHERAMTPPGFGRPNQSSDTIYLCTVDGEGNGCSFINSLFMGWGSGIVAQGTGIFLQNRGAGFRLEPDHPNALAGGKRPYHTIIPGLMTRCDELFGVFGVMGGFMQPQGHLQVVSALLDDDLNPQEALDRPRWCLGAGVSVSGNSELLLEDGIPLKTMAGLARLGHQVRPITGPDRAVFGSGQIILRDSKSGALFGGSDPRKDGLVAAY